jgi:hypothetical protein
MKTLLHIIFVAVLCLLALPAANAQTDTLTNARLFRNAKSHVERNRNTSIQQSAAQDDDDVVVEKLRTLEALYSAGKYTEVLELSRQIHENYRLPKAQSLLRQKYTIAAYKELEYHKEADSVARQFWKKDPFYTPVPYNPERFDPVPFTNVLNNYYTMPKFSVWAAAGLISGKPLLDTVHIIIDTLQRTPSYNAKGYLVQLGIGYRPVRILSISIAPTWSACEIERTSNRTGISTFYYKEKYRQLSLSLCMEASWFGGRKILVPSIYAGMQGKYLITSKFKAYETTNGVYAEVADYTINSNSKNRFKCALLGGVRLSVNIGRIAYFGDVGVSYDINPFNDPDKKLDDRALLYDKLYVPDIFHLLAYTVKVGVKVNLQYMTIAKFNYGY